MKYILSGCSSQNHANTKELNHMADAEHPLFAEVFAPGSRGFRLEDLEYSGAEFVFDISGAAGWIKQHRLPADGHLDMVRMAQSLGVPLSFDYDEPGYGRTWGVRGTADQYEPVTVKLSPQHRFGENVVTFGHELGHLVLDRVLGVEQPDGRQQEVENFCEIFGLEVALPRTALASCDQVNERVILGLMKTYGVGVTTILHQLVRANKAPRKFHVNLGARSSDDTTLEALECTFCMDCLYSTNACSAIEDSRLLTIELGNIEGAYSMSNCLNQRKWSRAAGINQEPAREVNE
jgi:hypothetical protein